MQLYDLICLIFLGTVLLVAAYQDLKNTCKTKNQYTGDEVVCGKVSNRLWVYSFPVGLVLFALRLFMYPQLTVLIAGNLVFVLIVSLLLFNFGGWGGADVKAAWLIGLTLPLMPSWGGLFPLPSAFFVLFISCGLAVAFGILKKSDVPFSKRTVRFLPFIFAGVLLTIFL